MCLVESYKGGIYIKKFLKNFFVIFLIILLISFIILKFYYNQSLIKFGKVGFLIVMSGSMEPTIVPKEMIIIKEQKEYEKGDIITYKDYLGRSVTHRIVSVDGEKVITKGDYNNTEDKQIKKENIQGKVIFHSICLGVMWLYVLKPIIIIICIGYILSFLKYLLFAKILLKICKYC